MKILLCFLGAFSLFSARAEELLKNGDFSDGKTHWFGDGVGPSDLTPDNPLAPKNPGAAEKELVVPLNPHHWTKVTQEFRTHAGRYDITIKFKAASDLKFSQDKEDYDKAYEDIGLWNSESFCPVGTFLYGIIDSAKVFALYSNGDLGRLEGKSGTLHVTVNDSGATSDAKTLYLAFPPGTGNVIIQSASVTTP